MSDVAWVHDACWSGLKIDLAFHDDAPVVCAVCGKPGIRGRGVSAVEPELLRKAKAAEDLFVAKLLSRLDGWVDQYSDESIDRLKALAEAYLKGHLDAGGKGGSPELVYRTIEKWRSAETDPDLEELKAMLVQAGPRCGACMACAGKTTSGVQFQEVLNRYRVVVDPSCGGMELRNGDGSLAARVHLREDHHQA